MLSGNSAPRKGFVDLHGDPCRAGIRIEKLSPRLQKSIFAITRIMAIFVFVILGWRVICLGQKFCKAGQISPILELPDYPVAYAVAVACFIECLVLLWTLVERVREGEA